MTYYFFVTEFEFVAFLSLFSVWTPKCLLCTKGSSINDVTALEGGKALVLECETMTMGGGAQWSVFPKKAK